LENGVARKAIQAARECLTFGFVDGMEYAKKRENVLHITTEARPDGLLGAEELKAKQITEALVPMVREKTQVGLSLAVNVQLPMDQGGANGKAVFIDTEGTFRRKE